VLKQLQSASVIDPLVQQLRQEKPTRGSAVLCSSPPDLASLTLSDHSNTQFTSALVAVLRSGAPQGGRKLTLSDVRDLVYAQLVEKNGGSAVRPEIRAIAQQEGDVSRRVRLFPNPYAPTFPGGNRHALLIANAQYDHPELKSLSNKRSILQLFKSVIERPDIGGYQTQVLVDQPKKAVEWAIDRILTDGDRNDTVLIYYDGHGLKGENGNLYFCVSDTVPMYLASTAVSAGWLIEQMENSRIYSKIVLLDCCFAAAFDRGHGLRGRGNQVVIATADAMQFAFEDAGINSKPSGSHFLQILTEGLETGDADFDGDGQVTADELFTYVVKRLRIMDSPQRPIKWTYGAMGGDLVFALNPL
jgi:Caspase domain